MKNRFAILFSAALALFFSNSFSQSLNTTQVGFLDYQEELSEVRGALHNGREYALVGVYNGFSIVDLVDPANPTEVFFEPGPNSIWRDPFYHDGYAYCVTEGGGGMLIVDMAPLPGSTNLSTSLYTGSNYPWSTAHNMFIDEPNDKAYIFGSDFGEGGAIILDISNPTNPVELGVWDDYYIHDGFVRGDTLWASCLEAGTFVVDVSTPSNPVVLTSWDTPSEFGHNVWPSDDNAFCYTTDEVESGFLAAYDMSNYQNIVEADKVHHPLSENVIPHNTHFINDYIVTSHYRDGLTIHDVSDPTNIILTGYFDSSPLSGGGFNGAWGAWPYLPSGLILVADIEEGLFVLDATYKRAARIEGTVTEFGSGNPLNDVQISISAANINENTNLFGNYASGTEAAGTYDVTFQKGGYLTQTISGVELVSGQITELDVELVPAVPFTVSGAVAVEGSGTPIEGADIQLTNDFFDLGYDSDVAGEFEDSNFFAGQYEVVVSAWGYQTQCATVTVDENNTTLSFELASGYYDDFATDLGWTVSGNASAGLWERVVPEGTAFGNAISNPEEDASGDCGEKAFVTGNDASGVGADDVDDGVTILTSPSMDLSSYTNPAITFKYWFFNAGGNSDPNDVFLVKVDNGTEVVTVGSLFANQNSWQDFGFVVTDHLMPTTDVKLILEVADTDPGHLVEGGFDLFRVQEGTSVNEIADEKDFILFPNPSKGEFSVTLPNEVETGLLKIHDMKGVLVADDINLKSGTNSINLSIESGVYICELIFGNERALKRLVIQ